MPAKLKPLPWVEWRPIMKELYAKWLKGWPSAEMKGYFNAGLSPVDALAAAKRRRQK